MLVPMDPNDKMTALVDAQAWHRIGDKPSSDSKMTEFTDAYAPSDFNELNVTNW